LLQSFLTLKVNGRLSLSTTMKLQKNTFIISPDLKLEAHIMQISRKVRLVSRLSPHPEEDFNICLASPSFVMFGEA